MSHHDKANKGKGKAKGKVKIPLCVINEETRMYELKDVPSPSVNGRIANEGAVYPLEDGTCPLLPAIVEDPVTEALE